MKEDKKELSDGYKILGGISSVTTFGILIGLILMIWFGIIGLKIAGSCFLIVAFMYPGLKQAGWYDKDG